MVTQRSAGSKLSRIKSWFPVGLAKQDFSRQPTNLATPTEAGVRLAVAGQAEATARQWHWRALSKRDHACNWQHLNAVIRSDAGAFSYNTCFQEMSRGRKSSDFGKEMRPSAIPAESPSTDTLDD